jgi:hypothetical protein
MPTPFACVNDELAQSDVDPGLELDLAAAELRADAGELHLLVSTLALRLDEALPRLVTVRRRRVGGFRSKETEITDIVLTLGEQVFELRREPAGFACSANKVVRGITLKREQLALHEWIEAVVAAVAALATITEQARIELERLVR